MKFWPQSQTGPAWEKKIEKNINLKIQKSILVSRLPNGIVQILNGYIQACLHINHIKETTFFVNYTSMTYGEPGFWNFEVKFSKFEKKFGAQKWVGAQKCWGPKWVGAQMIRGPNELGPKCVGAQMSQGLDVMWPTHERSLTPIQLTGIRQICKQHAGHCVISSE